MSKTILKPCPFCGSEPGLIESVRQESWSHDEFTVWKVKCTCGAEVTGHESEEITVSAWNRRIDEDDNYEGTLKITPSNCREVLEKAPRRIIISVVVKAMEELNKTIEDNTKCVGIIEYFQRAYKTRSAQKIHAALAQVFDDQLTQGTVQ